MSHEGALVVVEEFKERIRVLAERLAAGPTHPAHATADSVFYAYCRDALEAAQATLSLARSSVPRTAYFPARGVFECAQDALLLVGRAEAYDDNGALAYALERVEQHDLLTRFQAAQLAMGGTLPDTIFETPEEDVDYRAKQMDQLAPGSGAGLRAALIKARTCRPGKHWSGLSRGDMAKSMTSYIEDPAIGAMADAWYGLLSIHAHPRLRIWSQVPDGRGGTGYSSRDGQFAINLALMGLRVLSVALDARERLDRPRGS